MDAEALMLSRVQFALTTAFHIIFPSMTIGLALFLAFLEGMWLKTGRDVYLRLYRYWVKFFGLAFGIGVVSGVVLTFQFGLNFSRYSEFIGDVLGPLIGYEVLTAFFLEAGFIGIMLFGMNKVGPRLHFLATCLVALGTVSSSFWILAANSWMHTPDGFVLNAMGHAEPVDWWAVIFNPSFPYRLAHMVNAAMVSSAFLIAGISAWSVMKGKDPETMKLSLKLALGMAIVVAPLQAFIGDQHGLNTLEYQPIKIAAIEGHWETVSGAPLILFAWPDMELERNLWEVSVPYLGSLILTHSLDGTLVGLDSVGPEDRPYVPLVFFSFRLMAGIGFLLIAVAIWGQWLRHRGRLYEARRYHQVLMLVAPLGLVATIAGWVTTEAGRQPWVVHGLLRTADAVSPRLTAGEAWASLIGISIAYTIIFFVFLGIAGRMVARGPGGPVPTIEGAP